MMMRLFLILLISTTYPCFPFETLLEEKPKVTIIGAGLAGLTAGYRLQKLGIPVEIYEARSRPGGRVLTAYFESSYEELGGKSLLDGGDAETIQALIEEMGLTTKIDSSQGSRLVGFQNKIYTFSELFKDAPVPNDDLLTSLTHLARSKKSLGDIIDSIFGKNNALRSLLDVWMRGWEGSDSHSLSPLYIDHSFWSIYQTCYKRAYESPSSLFKTIDGGNTRLIETLAKALEGHIQYRHPLRKITKGDQGSILLHFDGKEPITTDYLILALPCSTLRDVSIEETMIPEDQMFAIDTLQYGTNAKILFPITSGITNLSTQNMSTWLNQDSKVMTWYYGGKQGIFDTSCPDEMAQIIERDIHLVQKVNPHLQFPNGIDPVSITSGIYTSPVAISWAQEEFSKGSYSNYGIDQYLFFNELMEEHGESVRKVFRSVNDRIFFAGEHTALDVPATLEGAVQSGERAARMVYHVQSCPH
jgi:monoamine oxidase